MARQIYACGCRYESINDRGVDLCPIHAERCVAEELDFEPVEQLPPATNDFADFCRTIDEMMAKLKNRAH